MKETDQLAHRLLAVGVLAGALIALIGLISDKPTQIYGGDALAYVNGAAITDETVNAIIERLPKSLTADEQRRQALDRAIEDTLLIQAAQALNLADNSRDVHEAMINNLVQRYAYLDGRLPIAEADLEAFYAETSTQFAPVKGMRIEQIFIARSSDASDRLSVVRSAIMAGESFTAIAQRLGDASPINFPRSLISPAQLGQILPGPLYQYVMRLRASAVTDAIETKQGWVFLHIAERQIGAPPALEAIRQNLYEALTQKILAETRAAHLDSLMKQANIDVIHGAVAE